MFACLHGSGNLAALALEFSPVVERISPDTVVLDASGLDRLFGHPHDVAAAMVRRAGEVQSKVSIALASNPDAAICAARGFSGISVVPYGDEAKFLATLPLSLLAPTPELMETLERWGIHRFQEMAALPPLGIAGPGGASPARTFRRWPRCRRWASQNGWARRGFACANWLVGKRNVSWCRWKIRCASKAKSSRTTPSICWSL
ncbi:hypothetical protein SBA3_2280007 [Candidatus Sulfopaludibacter sp. SbA3]|nr:hypothetical protein SBA3_2280007 [Candidatus Sulfopaludibacter sp. SbA3]